MLMLHTYGILCSQIKELFSCPNVKPATSALQPIPIQTLQLAKIPIVSSYLHKTLSEMTDLVWIESENIEKISFVIF